MSVAPLLEVRGLEVSFPVNGEWTPVVRGVSFAVGRGEVVGLVGESGSGKSMTALAVLGLVPPPGRVTAGRVWLARPDDDPENPESPVDLLTLGERALREVRGGRIAMVFQEPATAFNPVYSIGFQIAEAVRAHRSAGMSRTSRTSRTSQTSRPSWRRPTPRRRGCSTGWRSPMRGGASPPTPTSSPGGSGSAP